VAAKTAMLERAYSQPGMTGRGEKTPEPYSPEWFTTLDKIDPMLARHIREVLADAGRTDVCSICGDDTVADYHVSAKHVVALRLCNYCRDLYRSTYGGDVSRLPAACQGGEPLDD